MDDLTGRRVGAVCGRSAWALARQYFDGSILQEPVTVALRLLKSGRCELRYSTRRGFTYRVQSTPDPGQAFVDDPQGPFQAVDSLILQIDTMSAPRQFFRVVRSLE